MTRLVRLLLGSALLTAGCDPATFRPSRAAREYSSVEAAYRVKEAPDGCPDIGGVVEARGVSDIADTAARHGGTHFVIVGDAATATLETTTVGNSRVAVSSTEIATHHNMVARVYRCSP